MIAKGTHPTQITERRATSDNTVYTVSLPSVVPPKFRLRRTSFTPKTLGEIGRMLRRKKDVGR